MIYYNSDNLIKLNCDYNVVIGGRANGKSYDRAKKVIDDYFNTGNLFALVKRVGYGASRSADGLISWFCDDLQNYVRDKYNHYIFCSGERYYLIDIDDEFKPLENLQRKQRLNLKPFGYFFSLQNEQKYKSQQFDNVTTIIFEEFCPMSNYLYIDDEIEHFTSLISTIFRHRNGKVWLIGNTINKHNIYFEWLGVDIDKLKLKPGDIKKLVCTEYENGATIGIEFAKMSYENNDEMPRIFRVGKSQTATTGDYVQSENIVNIEFDKFIMNECELYCYFAIECDNILYYYFNCNYKSYRFNYITNRCKQQKVNANIIHVNRSTIECIKIGHRCINDIIELSNNTIELPTVYSDEYIEYKYIMLLRKINIKI